MEQAVPLASPHTRLSWRDRRGGSPAGWGLVFTEAIGAIYQLCLPASTELSKVKACQTHTLATKPKIAASAPAASH